MTRFGEEIGQMIWCVLAVWILSGIVGWGWLNFIVRGGSQKTPLGVEDVRWLRIQLLTAIVVGPIALIVCALIALVDNIEFELCFRP